MKQAMPEAFKIRDAFRNYTGENVQQDYDFHFEGLLSPLEKEDIKIDYSLREILGYKLPKTMSDQNLKEISKSNPMSMDDYWRLRYNLIVNTQLGEKLNNYTLDKKTHGYLMHVIGYDGHVFTVFMFWHTIKNCWRTNNVTGGNYVEKCIFLYFKDQVGADAHHQNIEKQPQNPKIAWHKGYKQ